MRKRTALLAPALFSLLGCSGMQVQQGQQSLQTKQEADAFCNRLYAAPALDPIRNKYPLKGLEINALHMGIESRPSNQEKAALAKFIEAREKCVGKQFSAARAMAPYQIPHLQDIKARHDDILAALYSGKITFGEANRLRKADQRLAGKDISHTRQQLQAQQQAHQAQQSANNLHMMETGLRMMPPPGYNNPQVTCRTQGTETRCW